MAPFDAAPEFGALSAERPAGENLEFDAEFGALERAAAGQAERQYGSTVIPAEPPDWKAVAEQATALLGRTRDLRVLVHLATARLNLGDFAGFATTLEATADLLDRQWAHVHPQLDAEEDNDPTLRSNVLMQLGHPTRVLRTLRDTPLARSAKFGIAVSSRDVAVAKGLAEPLADGRKLSPSQVSGVFGDAPPLAIAAVRDAAARAAGALRRIGAVFDEQAGAGSSPNLEELGKLLRQMQADIQANASAPSDAAPEAEPTAAEGAGLPAAPRAAFAGIAQIARIDTRADALRMLDLVCAYYEANEPASPLPLLIARARRLAEKSFLEVLRDIAPDGLSQARVVVGEDGDDRDR